MNVFSKGVCISIFTINKLNFKRTKTTSAKNIFSVALEIILVIHGRKNGNEKQPTSREKGKQTKFEIRLYSFCKILVLLLLIESAIEDLTTGELILFASNFEKLVVL